MAPETNSSPCINCSEQEYQYFFTATGFDGSSSIFEVAICSNCGLAKTLPELSEEEICSFYDNEYYGGSGKKKFTAIIEIIIIYANRLRANKIIRHIKSNQNTDGEVRHIRILDIGCGRALLLKEFRKFGCKCYCIERENFEQFGHADEIEYLSDPVESQSIRKNYFDGIILWHVLEHLNDPVKTIKEAVKKIKVGGILVITVPNFSSYQARLFKRHWFHLDIPRHTYHFPAELLEEILKKEQLTLINKTTFSFEQNPYGFIQSLLNMIVFFCTPNSMYKLLKKNDGWKNKCKLLCWVVLSALLFPLALTEYLLSGILNKGATVTYIMQK